MHCRTNAKDLSVVAFTFGTVIFAFKAVRVCLCQWFSQMNLDFTRYFGYAERFQSSGYAGLTSKDLCLIKTEVKTLRITRYDDTIVKHEHFFCLVSEHEL